MNHSWTQTLSVFLECNLHATDYQQCFHDRLPTTHFEDETINQDVISPGGPSRIRHYTQLLNSATQRCIRTHWRNDISQRYLLNGLYLTSCMDNDTETTFEQRECFLNPDKTSFDNFMMILGSVLMEWYTIILSLSTINTDGNPIKQSDRPRAKKVIIYVGEAHQFHIVEFLKRLYPDNTTMTITQDSSSEYYRRYHEHNRNRCTSKISIPLPYWVCSRTIEGVHSIASVLFLWFWFSDFIYVHDNIPITTRTTLANLTLGTCSKLNNQRLFGVFDR